MMCITQYWQNTPNVGLSLSWVVTYKLYLCRWGTPIVTMSWSKHLGQQRNTSQCQVQVYEHGENIGCTSRKENTLVDCKDICIEDESTECSLGYSETQRKRKATRTIPAAAETSSRARNVLEQPDRHRKLANASLCPD